MNQTMPRFEKCPQPESVVCAFPACLSIGCPIPDAKRVETVEAIWCAACGKYTDHGSATCPTIDHD